MKKLTTYILLVMTMFVAAACVTEEEPSMSKRAQVEALWKLMDENYCFFEYKKQELGVDWDEVRTRYIDKVDEDSTTALELFDLMADMLAELKDGHVNLSSTFDYARNWSFREDYPANCNDSIISANYLGTDYRIAGGLNYQMLEDSVGYIRCTSFSSAIGKSNVLNALAVLWKCPGLIIDVRNNGGGSMEYANTLASFFVPEKTLVGYFCHKTGKGHNDFSEPKAQFLDPATEDVRWNRPVIVLTNRACFSACNDFVKCMKGLPGVVIMGDRTGGGSGMPFSSELPCGWGVRYSSVVFYDHNMKHTEFGIDPDIPLQLSGRDTDRGLDTYIEIAKQIILAYKESMKDKS